MAIPDHWLFCNAKYLTPNIEILNFHHYLAVSKRYINFNVEPCVDETEHNFTISNCECYPPCEEMIYTPEITHARWPAGNSMVKLRVKTCKTFIYSINILHMIFYFKTSYCREATTEQERHKCLQRLQNDHLRVTVYLKQMKIEEYSEEPAMTVHSYKYYTV